MTAIKLELLKLIDAIPEDKLPEIVAIIHEKQEEWQLKIDPDKVHLLEHCDKIIDRDDELLNKLAK